MTGRLLLYLSLHAVNGEHSRIQREEHDTFRLTFFFPDESEDPSTQREESRFFTLDVPARSTGGGALQLDNTSGPTTETLILGQLLTDIHHELRRINSGSMFVEKPLRRALEIVKNDVYVQPWLEEACNILHNEFMEQPKLCDVAMRVDIHPVHLAREFRKRFGLSVRQYARKLQVDFACKQLLASDDPPAQIATAAGFSDQSHFSRIFKRVQGITPGRYRAILRADNAVRSAPTNSLKCPSQFADDARESGVRPHSTEL